MEKKKDEVPKRQADYYNLRLEEILGCGRFQYFIIFTFVALISLLCGMDAFQIAFTISEGQHRCSLPPEIEQRLDFQAFENNKNLVGTCEIAVFDNSSLCLSLTTADELVESGCFSNSSSEKLGCKDAFGFVQNKNYSGEFWSLKSEKKWLCGDSYLGDNIYAAKIVGMIFWLLISMQIIDTWGRKPVVYGTCIITATFRILAFLLTDYYYVMIACLAISAPFANLGLKAAVMMNAEYTNPKGRYICYAIDWVFYVTGVALLPVVAWLSQDWFTYGMVVPASLVIILPFYWLTPESPRLLLTQGKVDEAEAVIKHIKKINKEEISKDLHDELVEISEAFAQPDKLKCASIFKCRQLVYNLGMLMVTWIVNDLLYEAGQLNAANLAGNHFVNFTLIALTEMPACFVGQLMVDKLGRRWSQVICMLTNVVILSTIVIIITVEGEVGPSVTGLSIVSKISSNVAWYVMWIQMVEICPTDVRGSATNLVGIISHCFLPSAPYLSTLGLDHPRALYGIFASAALIGAIAASFLPETHGQPLLECIDDIDKRKRYPFFSFRVWKDEKESPAKTLS